MYELRRGQGVNGRTSNLNIAGLVGSNPFRGKLLFREQENLLLMLSPYFLKERDRKCFNKFITSNTIELK
jgi:hypothetical protein